MIHSADRYGGIFRSRGSLRNTRIVWASRVVSHLESPQARTPGFGSLHIAAIRNMAEEDWSSHFRVIVSGRAIRETRVIHAHLGESSRAQSLRPWLEGPGTHLSVLGFRNDYASSAALQMGLVGNAPRGSKIMRRSVNHGIYRQMARRSTSVCPSSGNRFSAIH